MEREKNIAATARFACSIDNTNGIQGDENVGEYKATIVDYQTTTTIITEANVFDASAA